MSKRICGMLLAIVMLAACLGAAAESAILFGVGGSVKLKLETSGTGKAKGHGGDVTVTIHATDGVLTAVEAVGEKEDMGGMALAELPEQMVAGNTINVDAITGATETSDAIKEAAAKALKDAGLDAGKFQKHYAPAGAAPAKITLKKADAQPAAEEAPKAEAAAENVDAYTTASATKTVLSAEGITAIAPTLEALSSTLSTTADTQKEGYAPKEGTATAQIMTVNEDGSVGLSTISEWAFSGADCTVQMKLTHGQNALNLTRENAAGTLLVKAEGAVYLLHLQVKDVDVLEYSDAAYEAGEFDQFYSGAPNKLAEYHITCDVTAIEVTYALMF